MGVIVLVKLTRTPKKKHTHTQKKEKSFFNVTHTLQTTFQNTHTHIYIWEVNCFAHVNGKDKKIQNERGTTTSKNNVAFFKTNGA